MHYLQLVLGLPKPDFFTLSFFWHAITSSKIKIFQICKKIRVSRCFDYKNTSKKIEILKKSIFRDFFNFKPLCLGKEVNQKIPNFFKIVLGLNKQYPMLKYAEKNLLKLLKNKKCFRERVRFWT